MIQLRSMFYFQKNRNDGKALGRDLIGLSNGFKSILPNTAEPKKTTGIDLYSHSY